MNWYDAVPSMGHSRYRSLALLSLLHRVKTKFAWRDALPHESWYRCSKLSSDSLFSGSLCRSVLHYPVGCEAKHVRKVGGLSTRALLADASLACAKQARMYLVPSSQTIRREFRATHCNGKISQRDGIRFTQSVMLGSLNPSRVQRAYLVLTSQAPGG